MRRVLVRSSKGNRVALVDDVDYPEVSKYRWHLTAGGYAYTASHRKGASREDMGRTVNLSMARLVRPAGRDVVVDHINGRRLDNRRSNLQIISSNENKRRRHRYVERELPIAVTYTASGRKFGVHVNNTHYGNYDDMETAGMVADRVRRSFGFIVFNYPNRELPEGYPIPNFNIPVRVRGTSTEPGVCWHKTSGKWRAVFRNKHIGYFREEHEAITAIRSYAEEHEHENSKCHSNPAKRASPRI